ncbi:type IX secretion system plug protein domain-containing protein [Gelidibacter sp.]|uniref:type IX secretion system plug protein n=1 Tax=Gelidibacter sp. TaxID=2018083 RepID=UPI002C3535E0|nr:type IX secretion system plug protein domain-containing protein [Gelidibacter sp.]HUH29571.1 type IX secretion system plug protein domain-containing protein [Gelidibacter sp.]
MTSNLRYFLLLFFYTACVFSQIEEVNPPDYIKTIMFRGNTDESQLPILKLGEPLLLEFDALTGTEPDFYYVIEHFNYDWTPSNLVKSEYLRGFDNQRIQDYKNSFNTYQIYSHYMLQIPNQQTKGLLVTGNYLMSIYKDDDELVFSRKFMIYEDLVNVGVAIKRSRDVKDIDKKQSVDIVINSRNINFNNPLENVKSLIIQNNNLNTAISNVKPQYLLGNQLIYKYTSETSFWGGNEYLYFETKDVRAANVGVQFIDLKDIYHTYLFANTSRANQLYTYNPDINGNFVITAIDAQDVSIEADYTMIHFALQYPELTDGSSVYVYGNFNNYALEPDNELQFNSKTGLYEKAFRLKQGFYNYKYVVTDKNGTLNEGAISGDFYQTENNYKVLVYYRDLGARYDRLIGMGEGSSVDISN